MVTRPTNAEAQVSFPSDREVLVTREFRAPRDLVYRAFTTPDLLRRWLLGPPGWTMPVCEMDVRVGGRFRWMWRSDEHGRQFGFHGEFRVVEPPSRLVHTEIYDPGDVGGSMGDAGESLVEMRLDEARGVTTMTARMDFGSKEARDAAIASGMTGGMEMSYQLLDRLLARAG